MVMRSWSISKSCRSLQALGGRCFSNQSGSIAVPTAIIMVVLVGFAALALEVTGLFFTTTEKCKLQLTQQF